jgi:head-tail adaptor
MSSTLTAAEIANMRTSYDDVALPDTCNILSVTDTSDGQGGITQAWGTTYIGTACRLDTTRGYETVQGGAVQAFRQYVLHLPYNTPITEANRVEVGSYTYSIVSVDYGKSWMLDTSCEVERI